MASKKAASPKWSTLGTSSGKGARIPRLLRDLRSPDRDTQDEAMRALGLLVVDDGQAYEAAAPVLEAVVDIAPDATVVDRFGVVGLARHIVSLGRTEAIDLQGIALGEPELAECYGRPHAKAILEAAERCVPTIVALLFDSDLLVVAQAANFLGILPTTTPEVISALGRRLSRASESGLEVSLMLALSLLARRTRAVAAQVKELLDARPRPGATPMVDGALAVARTIAYEALPPDISTESFGGMFSGLAAISEVFHLHSKNKTWSRSVSWGGGRIDAIADCSLPRGPAHEAFVEAAASACARSRLTGGSALKREWPAILLASAFEERSLYERPLDAAGLSPRQRVLLERLSVHEDEGPYQNYGVAPDLRGRRRWLGVDPPGVLERWLDVWMELDMKPYGVTGAPAVWNLALEQASARERRAFVERWALELRRWPEEESIRSSSYRLFFALSLDTPAEEPLTAQYDDLFTLFGPLELVPALLARIPRERREAIALREVERGATFAYRAERFADLVPKAAAEYVRRTSTTN